MTPRRVAGDAIAPRPVSLSEGTYDISAPIRGREVVLTSCPDLASYWREIGLGHPRPVGSNQLDGDFLRRHAGELARLLGADLEPLRRADERGRRSSTPPRGGRHPVLELIDLLVTSAEALDAHIDGDSLTLDGDRIVEAIALTNMYSRWANHPFIGQLAMIKNRTDVHHNLTVLVVGANLAEHGNAVGLVDGRGGDGRRADLFVQTAILTQVMVEVKAPEKLRYRHGDPVSPELATAEVGQLYRDAGSARRGQLTAGSGGILAIGAFGITPSDTDTLERAARDILDRCDRTHVMAIVVCSSSFVAGVAQDRLDRPVSSFRPAFDVRVCEHPGYEGPVRMSTAPWSQAQSVISGEGQVVTRPRS